MSWKSFVLISFILASTLTGVSRGQGLFEDLFVPTPDAKEQGGSTDTEAEDQEDEKARKEAEEKKLLDALEKKLEDLIVGKDKFSTTVSDLEEKFKAEFHLNEQKFAESKRNEQREILDRQRLIAQYMIDLSMRKSEQSRFGMNDQVRKVNDALNDFRREHPQLGRNERFREMQREMPQRAMRNRRGFAGSHEQPTLTSMMKRLSAGEVLKLGEEIESTRAHPGEQRGPITGRRDALRAMLKLHWDGEQLRIDRRHWDVPYAGQSAGDINAEVTAMLEERGVKLNQQQQQQRQMAMMQRFGGTGAQSNILRLFDELRGSTRTGYGRTAQGDAVRTYFQDGALHARLLSSSSSFELVLQELHGPSRTLRVADSDKGLSIVLLGDNLIHRFHQQPDGTVSVVEVLDDEVVSQKAQSAAQLYGKEPRFVEDRFFALLDHIGVVAPLTRFHPYVVEQLIETLATDQDAIRSEVAELVRKLDASRFATRESAYAELKQGIEEYYECLYGFRKDNELSREVRARIGKLLAFGSGDNAVHAGSLVSVMGLASDADYLDEVRDLVKEADRALVDERLKQLVLE